MEAKAVAKYIRISPQKARLVADVVRGKDVESAITTLRFMPKKRLKFCARCWNQQLPMPSRLRPLMWTRSM